MLVRNIIVILKLVSSSELNISKGFKLNEIIYTRIPILFIKKNIFSKTYQS